MKHFVRSVIEKAPKRPSKSTVECADNGSFDVPPPHSPMAPARTGRPLPADEIQMDDVTGNDADGDYHLTGADDLGVERNMGEDNSDHNLMPVLSVENPALAMFPDPEPDHVHNICDIVVALASDDTARDRVLLHTGTCQILGRDLHNHLAPNERVADNLVHAYAECLGHRNTSAEFIIRCPSLGPIKLTQILQVSLRRQAGAR